MNNDPLKPVSKKRKRENVLTKQEQKELNIQLQNAAYKGDTDTLKIVIDKGAQVNTGNHSPLGYVSSALIDACEQDHIDTVKILLNAQANVNILDQQQNTPLLLTTNAPIVSILLYAKAHTHIPCLIGGQTPLHHAIENTIKEKIHLLILAQANLDQPDNKGRTPRDIASNLAQSYIITAQEEKLLSDQLNAILLSEKDAYHHGLPLPHALLLLIAEYATAPFSPLDMARFDREHTE